LSVQDTSTGLATVTRAGYAGIDSSTLITGHQQTEEMPDKMAAFSVDTNN